MTLGVLAANFVKAEKPTNYFEQSRESIPEGRTVSNGGGFKQDLIYSTVTNSRGKQYFDMTLTLEGNEVNDEYVILQFFQIVDEKETADLNSSDCEGSDFEKGICFYYESLTCSFQYKDTILDGGVSIANSIIQGYKGVKEMKDGIGAFD